MAVPNVNQAYDLIVVKDWKGVFDGTENHTSQDALDALTTAGDVAFVTGAANANGTKCGRFLYKDNDAIKSTVLVNAGIFSQYQSKTRIAATKTKYQRKTVIIEPKSAIFDANNKTQSNDVAAIHLIVKNFQVVGEYNTYMTDGCVQMNTNLTKNELLFGLAKSLIKNMSRTPNLGINVYLGTKTTDASSNPTGVTSVVSMAQIAAAKSVSQVTMTNVDCIAIQEAPLKWDLGRFYFERPSFDVTTSLAEIGIAMPVEMAWAEDVTDNTVYDNQGVANGRMVAEIEYAAQAQRGDFWGRGGYPYTFHADGLVDPTKEYDIAILDITYRGDAEDVQYSPKQLFIVMEKANSAATPLNTLMSAINSYLA